MLTPATRHFAALLYSASLLASCSHTDTLPHLSPKLRAQARELMAQSSQQLCNQTYANDAVRYAALIAAGRSVSQQCECTHDMSLRFATERQAIDFLQAIAHGPEFNADEMSLQTFWSLEHFEAVHHAAMHACEQQGEISAT